MLGTVLVRKNSRIDSSHRRRHAKPTPPEHTAKSRWQNQRLFYSRLCPSLSEPLAVAHPDQVVMADLEALKTVAAVSLVLLNQEVFTATR